MKPVTEGQLAVALAKHHLARIEVTLHSGHGRKITVHARALPASWHPKVAERREAEFAKLGDSVTLPQAQKITEATMVAVAGFSAPTIDAALRGLLELLK